MGAAVSSIVIYITMKSAIQTVLKNIGIEASLRVYIFVTLWLAVSLLIISTIGWLIHLCYCIWV